MTFNIPCSYNNNACSKSAISHLKINLRLRQSKQLPPANQMQAKISVELTAARKGWLTWGRIADSITDAVRPLKPNDKKLVSEYLPSGTCLKRSVAIVISNVRFTLLDACQVESKPIHRNCQIRYELLHLRLHLRRNLWLPWTIVLKGNFRKVELVLITKQILFLWALYCLFRSTSYEPKTKWHINEPAFN